MKWCFGKAYLERKVKQMAISWIEARGKNKRQTADVEVNYGKKTGQYLFNFTQGAHATKFKNTERIMVGANDSLTRIYFCPVKEKLGYKVCEPPRSVKRVVAISGAKMSAMFPALSPSSVIGTYDLKYDEVEKLYYISIGALPR